MQTKSEFPSQDCVLLTVGVLKLLTTHSHRSTLDFLCSLTFFSPRLSESALLLSYAVFCEHQWRDIANVLHLRMIRERLYGAVTHTDVNSCYNTNPFCPGAALVTVNDVTTGVDVLLLICIYGLCTVRRVRNG